MSSNVVLLGASVGAASATANGLIRKQILPRNKSYRWPNQPGRMLTITDEVIEQVKANFAAGIIDVVPFFKVNDKNQHVEDPELQRGKIVDLVEMPDGLDALLSVPDPEVAKQILEGGLGASAGMDLAFRTKDDGTNVGAVLRHVAWTPEPWISGMRPFERVSLSSETFEAVYLSADEGVNPNYGTEGGENDMTPEEIRALVAEQVTAQTATLSSELEETKTLLGTANSTIATLSASLTQRTSGEVEAAVNSELDAMVEAGLPPAIADLARPVLLAGSTEVNLSGNETGTVAGQVRKMLELMPKLDMTEIGEAGVPEGAMVVLSAEQVKELGFKVKATEDDDEGDKKVALSAEEQADQDAIDRVSALLPKYE